MGLGSTYKINLLSVTSDLEVFEYHIDDVFFNRIEGSAILGGDVDVKCSISLSGNAYSVSMSYSGEIMSVCDRCLSDVYFDVDFCRNFIIRFTDGSYDEDEDYIDIPRKDGVIDISEVIYSDLALSLPMVVTHEDGQCDEDMMKEYANMMVGEIPQDGVEKDEEGIDLRWGELKKLRKN